MTCSVPGCPNQPDEDIVRVKATPATNLEQEPRSVALTHLCHQHRQEFEELGWLAPDDDEEGDDEP